VKDDLQAARAHWPLDVAVKTAINAAMSIDAVPLHVKLWLETEQRDRSKAGRKTKDGRVRVEPKGPNALRSHDPALIAGDGITTYVSFPLSLTSTGPLSSRCTPSFCSHTFRLCLRRALTDSESRYIRHARPIMRTMRLSA
jgi:hypothetical protein